MSILLIRKLLLHLSLLFNNLCEQLTIQPRNVGYYLHSQKKFLKPDLSLVKYDMISKTKNCLNISKSVHYVIGSLKVLV